MQPTISVRDVRPALHALDILLVAEEEIQQHFALPVRLHRLPALIPLKDPDAVVGVETPQDEECICEWRLEGLRGGLREGLKEGLREEKEGRVCREMLILKGRE